MPADKQALRAEMRARLAAVPEAARRAQSAEVARVLDGLLDAERLGGPVAFFASMPHELDTTALDATLMRRGLARALPRIEGGALAFHLVEGSTRDLARDRLGIPTPDARLPVVALRACALIVVPGLAFDGDGRRLGYGRGYYDRALPLAPDVPCVGVLLDVQRVPRVPVDVHDVPLARTCSAAEGLVVHAPARGR